MIKLNLIETRLIKKYDLLMNKYYKKYYDINDEISLLNVCDDVCV
jgi:hypothetical protein